MEIDIANVMRVPAITCVGVCLFNFILDQAIKGVNMNRSKE